MFHVHDLDFVALQGRNHSAAFQQAMHLCRRHTARLSVSLLKLLMQFCFDAKAPKVVLPICDLYSLSSLVFSVRAVVFLDNVYKYE